MTARRRVFLSHSYAESDRVACRMLIILLRAAGIDFWYDERDLTGGAAISRRIIADMATCTDFVVMLSPAALESLYVLGECFLALNLRQRGDFATMISYVAHPTEIPPLLAARLYVDAALGADQAGFKLLQALGLEDAVAGAALARLRAVGLDGDEARYLASLPLVTMLEHLERRLHPTTATPVLWQRAGRLNVTSAVFALAWSPDGRWIATGSQDRKLRVWNAATLACEQVLAGHQHYIDTLAWSPDSQSIVSASVGQVIRLWDVARGQETRQFAGHSADVKGVAWSPDGRKFVSASTDGTVRVWDLTSGAARLTMRVAAGARCTCVDWSPDGGLIAAGATDALIYVWDATTGDLCYTLSGHNKIVYSVRWSPDGRQLASSGETTIKIWDLERRVFSQEFHGHTGLVETVAWRPDGKLLASGSADRTVRLWSLSGERVTIDGGAHGDWTHAVAWSPDGQTLASGGGQFDNHVLLWRPAAP